MALGMIMVSNFRHGLVNNCTKRDTKVCDDNVHEANARHVPTIVDYNISVFEDKERLKEYEEKAEHPFNDSDRECYLAVAHNIMLIIIKLE